MKVICHYLGGYHIKSVRLSHGENIVRDELWQEAFDSLSDVMKAALFGGNTPIISVDGGPGEQPSLPLAPTPAPTRAPAPTQAPAPAREEEPKLAKDVIAAIEAATEPDELEQLADGETRKTVLAAIKKRAKQLSEAAA